MTRGCEHTWVFFGNKEKKEEIAETRRKYICTKCMGILYYNNDIAKWETTDDAFDDMERMEAEKKKPKKEGDGK